MECTTFIGYYCPTPEYVVHYILQVALQQTVVMMNTIFPSGAATYPSDAHAAEAGSSRAVAHETTAVPGRSSSGR